MNRFTGMNFMTNAGQSCPTPCPPPCPPPCPGPPGPVGPTGATGAVYLGKMTVCKNAVPIKPPRYGY